MHRIVLGILGSGKGSNCRAILEQIRAGKLKAECRVVISDVEEAGILAIARDFQVPAVFLSPGKFRTKLEPEVEEELVRLLRAAGVELVVLAGFMRVLKTPMLEAFPRRIINLHPSLLPKYRGAAPVHRAVIAGDAETGVTIMRIAPRMDAGDTFAQRTHPIGAHETSEELEDALAVVGARLLVEVADSIADGTAHEEPQDERLATHAARLTKEDGLLDWSLSATRIHDRVRGLFPWPHAYSYVEGRRIIIWRTRPLGHAAAGPPGTVVNAGADGVSVTTGDGVLALLELQAEGGRALPAADFLRGHPLPPGVRFDSQPRESGQG